ncbi:MAG: hypothetical protein L0Y80_02465 [Ignavibacteriae bacterium]|nr:hypothetical protein [Ignavibacteriota bacterium]
MLSDQGMIATVLIGIFYGGVVSVILISFWKIHIASKEIKEIKKILLDLQVAFEQSRR